VEVEAEGGPVRRVVPVEVVPQHAAELLRRLDVGAGADLMKPFRPKFTDKTYFGQM
jgi:hypothetical protein